MSDAASSTQGTRTLIEYKQITDETGKRFQLREYGLTEEEIEMKIKCESINVSLWRLFSVIAWNHNTNRNHM